MYVHVATICHHSLGLSIFHFVAVIVTKTVLMMATGKLVWNNFTVIDNDVHAMFVLPIVSSFFFLVL